MEATAVAADAVRAKRLPWRHGLRRLRGDPFSAVGIAIVSFLVLTAIAAPYLAHHDPTRIVPEDRLLPPDAHHLLGTDHLGRDVLTRIVYGARLSLLAAVAVTAISAFVGILIGTVSGYLGGATDEALMRITDVFQSFPWMILAMAVAMAAGPSLWNGLLALSFVWWPDYARLMRGQVLATKTRPFVEAARAVGVPQWRVVRRHVLPNAIGPFIIMLTIGAGRIILAMASLSFLGLGAQPPSPEWGVMVAEGRTYLFDAWWIVAYPGLAVLFAVIGFNLVGDAVRDVLDPTGTVR
jgi:peptide/nickel transport system permease protein